jgi:preprotein translocase subunit SecA
LLKHFGGPSLPGLFERLGMAGDSCITHPLVTSAIRNAQAKIEKEVQMDLQTESIEDWFKYNLERKP